jgi:hypothetical protein
LVIDEARFAAFAPCEKAPDYASPDAWRLMSDIADLCKKMKSNENAATAGRDLPR